MSLNFSYSLWEKIPFSEIISIPIIWAASLNLKKGYKYQTCILVFWQLHWPFSFLTLQHKAFIGACPGFRTGGCLKFCA